MAAASKKGKEPAQGSASDPKSSDKIMRDSGSSWDENQVKYYNIKASHRIDLVKTPIFNGIKTRKLDEPIAKSLRQVDSTYLSKRSFKELMMPAGGLGVMFGPFLTLMARIKEAPPGSNDRRSQPERAGKENVKYNYGYNSESEGEGSDNSFAPSTNTDRSAHLARAKPEAPTQVMIYLFGTLVYEGSNLPSRVDPVEQTSWCLEWDVAPKKFKIESPKVMCTTISDGGLLAKGFSGGKWGEKSDLVYCSVEVSDCSVYPLVVSLLTGRCLDQGPFHRLERG